MTCSSREYLCSAGILVPDSGEDIRGFGARAHPRRWPAAALWAGRCVLTQACKVPVGHLIRC